MPTRAAGPFLGLDLARVSRAGLALLALTFAACFEGPPAWRPLPIVAGPPSEGCAHAHDLRARVPGLMGEGRLDRAVRVMQRAEDLCPVETEATWAPHVTALAGLGRAAEAMQLVHRIGISDRATDEDRRAAEAARAVAEEQGHATAARGGRRDDPELFDPSEKDRAAAAVTFHRGAIAERAGDHAAAEKLFLEAWATSHPNPRALVEAGIAAAAGGDRAAAHKLWDRAAFDDSSVALRPEIADGAPESFTATVPAAWSPGGDRLAVGGRVEIGVYDADLVPLFRLRTVDTAVALAFSADGARLFAGLDSGGVVVFDVATGARERELAGHRGAARLIAPSPDRRTLATVGDDGALRIWDLEAGGVPRVVPLPHGATALAWSADSTQLSWAGEDRRITLWDAQKGAPLATLAARAGAVRAIAFEGGSLVVVTATERMTYDVARPRLPPKVAARDRADEASFAPAAAGGHGAVAVVTGADIAVRDAASDQAIASVRASDHGGLAGFAPAPGGRSLAVVLRDRTLELVPSGGAPGPANRRRIVRPAPLDALAVAADGKTLAAASEDGRVLVWSAAPSRFRTFDPGLTRALAFSPDGRMLALGLATGRIEVRDPLGDAPGAELAAGSGVSALAFSPDGMRLAAATDASAVLVFEAATRSMARELHLAPGPARAMRFSPDGGALLLAAKEGVVRWDLARNDTAHLAAFGPDPRDAAFTPDGTGIAVADARGLLLLGKLGAAAPAPTKLSVPSQVLALAVAKSGSIATAEGDRAVGLRTAEGKPMARFSAPDAAVRDVAFLGTGLVVGAFSDGAVRVFRAPATGAAAVLRPVPGMRASLVLSGGGLVDVVGPDAAAARATVRCRLGHALYPFEVCADQFEVPGIFQIVLAGQDPAEADP